MQPAVGSVRPRNGVKAKEFARSIFCFFFLVNMDSYTYFIHFNQYEVFFIKIRNKKRKMDLLFVHNNILGKKQINH